MSGIPRTFKRPFQPGIKSYFHTFEPDQPRIANTSSTSSLVIHTSIQSSLLNVGMRVRKAVPDGYKTKPLSDTPSVITYSHLNSVSQAQCQAYQGLVSYSGILKIGAYEAEYLPGIDTPSLQFDDEISCPSSRESISTDAMPTAVHPPIYAVTKRRRPEEDQDGGNVDIGPLSLRAGYPTSHTEMPKSNVLRTVANPKTRKPQPPRMPKVSLEERINMANAGDFEEAEFFRPEDWVNADMEF